jgi:cytoskeletal protein RodZ
MPDNTSLSITGAELKRRRLSLHLSLTQVELATKIRGKYLTAIETGDYANLPNDVYSRGFVHQYASHLGLNGADIARAYAEERGGLQVADTAAPRLERPKRLVVTGRIATFAIAIIIILGLGSYLAWQFSSLAAPPTIVIVTPGLNQTVTGGSVTVSGRVTQGADVSIDDVSVASDTDGNFSSPVSLQNGLNTIRVSARSKLGKQSSLSRAVLANLPAPVVTTGISVPQAVFNGVAVAVTAHRNLALSVSVDGQVFKQILLKGTSKLFQGTADISLTTSDAGATSLSITNSVMVAKQIASLGGDGETRTGQDFTATTTLP